MSLTSIHGISLSPADSGHKLSYFEKTKVLGMGDFGEPINKHVELAFSEDETSDAIEKYKELTALSRSLDAPETTKRLKG